MSNPMKYIKDLEAAGFMRNQAEAQVQMVLDALEGDLVTKSDFAVFEERIENRFERIDNRFERIEYRFTQSQQYIQSQIKESEFRLITRLGFLTVSTVSIAVAVLTWLIKI
jgi:hypothetical protein